MKKNSNCLGADNFFSPPDKLHYSCAYIFIHQLSVLQAMSNGG